MTNITDNQKLILSFLSKALFRRDISVPKNTDWDAIYEESVAQTVLPLVYSAASDSIPFEIKAKWQQSVYQTLANNVHIIYEHKEVHKLLAGDDIPYTIIKGVASSKYYPEPRYRIMGDIDFVVRAEDLSMAGKLLEKAGFTCANGKEHMAHIVYHRGYSTWEMHWSMSGIPTGDNGKNTREYFSEIIDTAIYDSEGYMIPDEFHHGLVLLIHTAEHLVNTGIGLRHLCDWAVFEESFSDEEFKSLFEKKLKACGLWRFAQLLTQLSIVYLGASNKPWANENRNTNYLEKMILDIFAGGNFGTKDSERINQAKLLTNKGKGKVGDKGFLCQLIQTMNERSRRALPVVRRIPFMLPIGWWYVGMRHLLRIRKGIRPTIHIRRMIDGASERREIYKEFHLYEKLRK